MNTVIGILFVLVILYGISMTITVAAKTKSIGT